MLNDAGGTNWVAIDNLTITETGGSTSCSTYSENFTSSSWNPSSIPYYSDQSASNSYAYLWSGGVGGSFDYYAALSPNFDVVEGGSSNIVTKEINTTCYSYGELRYAFKAWYPCGGPTAYTYNEGII